MCPDPITLSAYYDSEVSPQESLAIKKHLKECSHCREILEDYARQSEALGLLSEQIPQRSHVPEELVSRLEAPRRNVWNHRVSVPWPLAAAAALFMFFLSFSFIQMQSRISSGTLVFIEQPKDISPGDISLEDPQTAMLFSTIEMDIPLDMEQLEPGDMVFSSSEREDNE